MENMENIEIVKEAVAEPVAEIVKEAAKSSGMSPVAKGAIILVGVVTTGVAALFGYKAVRKHKEEKELRKPEDGKVVEPTDEQMHEATHK